VRSFGRGATSQRFGVILAHTSAWVEFDRATGSSVDLRLTEFMSRGGELVIPVADQEREPAKPLAHISAARFAGLLEHRRCPGARSRRPATPAAGPTR
jgi:hypothetical protein